MENMCDQIREVENMWKRILFMPDRCFKAVKVLEFSARCVPHGYWWTIAMNELHRLYKLGYWKWQDESSQNG